MTSSDVHGYDSVMVVGSIPVWTACLLLTSFPGCCNALTWQPWQRAATAIIKRWLLIKICDPVFLGSPADQAHPILIRGGSGLCRGELYPLGYFCPPPTLSNNDWGVFYSTVALCLVAEDQNPDIMCLGRLGRSRASRRQPPRLLIIVSGRW